MKLLFSEKAEAELVGHVIILGITILGVSMISLYGIPAIFSLQDMANVKNVEQTFTVLDSQASRAVIGESPLQITNINLGGGSLTVEPNSTSSPSYIMVNSTIFNLTIPMGKITYKLGDRIVAYEGGGVWSKYPSATVMLSRPEFHYNGVTLTLPVFNISGNASVGGRGTVSVSVKKPATQVLFPSPNGVNRTNPVNFTQVGKVYVTIKSDFYDAWADHIGTLSSTKVVSRDKTNSTARIELTVYPAYIGRSDSSIADPVVFRGLDGSNSTPLNNFSFRITTDKSNLNWDIRAESGNKRLIFYLKDDTSWNEGKTVTLQIGYQEGDDGSSGIVEAWEGNGVYTIQQDNYIYVDLLNNSINLTYKSNGVGSTSSNDCDPDQIGGGSDFNGTGFSWTDIPFSGSTKKSLYNITQHYIQKMAQGGDFSFNHCGKTHRPSVDSNMLIDYYAPGGLTYLHITDNKADVGIS